MKIFLNKGYFPFCVSQFLGIFNDLHCGIIQIISSFRVIESVLDCMLTLNRPPHFFCNLLEETDFVAGNVNSNSRHICCGFVFSCKFTQKELFLRLIT